MVEEIIRVIKSEHPTWIEAQLERLDSTHSDEFDDTAKTDC